MCSVNVDTHNVVHGASTEEIFGNDEAQPLTRKRCPIHVIRQLNRLVGELRGDFTKRDHGRIPVRAGDSDREMSLIARPFRIDCSGGV